MTQPIMLDTNIVSYIIGKNKSVIEKFDAVDHSLVCISAVTYGEILFGLERRPGAKSLEKLTRAFLSVTTIVPWDAASAEAYGVLRARQEKLGKPLERLDMMIAAHATALGALLVTADRAFSMIDDLPLDNWYP